MKHLPLFLSVALLSISPVATDAARVETSPLRENVSARPLLSPKKDPARLSVRAPAPCAAVTIPTTDANIPPSSAKTSRSARPARMKIPTAHSSKGPAIPRNLPRRKPENSYPLTEPSSPKRAAPICAARFIVAILATFSLPRAARGRAPFRSPRRRTRRLPRHQCARCAELRESTATSREDRRCRGALCGDYRASRGQERRQCARDSAQS